MSISQLSFILLSWTLIFSCPLVSSLTNNENNEENNPTASYGVDVSFPIHHQTVSTNYPWLPHNKDPKNYPTPLEYQSMPIQPLGNRQKVYDEFIQGCKTYYGHRKEACTQTEYDRVVMSKRQPSSMQNYTDTGFKKIRMPDTLWKLLQTFWDKNKENKVLEQWTVGNTYTNHWAAPTYMVSVENSSLRGGGSVLKQAIWDAAKATIEEWTGQALTQCSLYGIRIYTEGAILAPHVDRLPLVSSAIVNVDQDVDEPWPIEVYGRDGKAYNVTMEPGDMVLYESHSLLHGRPFPLKGRYFANVFIHFEPVGHSNGLGIVEKEDEDVHEKYKKSVQQRHGGHENGEPTGLPVYIVEGSEEAEKWKLRHRDNKRSAKGRSFQSGSTAAHKAAMVGDVEGLKELIDIVDDFVNKKDSNGWSPLHEGARGGHTEVVQILIERGANVNELTNYGETPLYLAVNNHGDDHPLVDFLRNLGGVSLGPEL